jgi:transcriptional regulator with XRE-family HTH domain
MDRELGDPINSPRTGKDLQAWRKALGLRQTEVARLLDVNPNTISEAERDKSAPLKGKVLIAVQLLQHRIVHGEIDLSPIFKKRVPRGRPRKKR